jgi:hypothetical protein
VKLTLDDPALAAKTLERIQNDGDAEAEALRDIACRERSVCARIPTDQIPNWVGHRFDERCRHTDGQGDSEGVAKTARVFDNGPPIRSRDPGAKHTVCSLEFGEPDGHEPFGSLRDRIGKSLGNQSLRHFVDREGTENAKQVDNAFEPASLSIGCEPLQLRLGLDEHLWVEQLAEFRTPQEFSEQRRIQAQGGGTPFSERRVALVHERGDVSEEQRAGKR